MKLVTVEVALAPAAIEAVLASIEAQAEAVRARPGCVHYALYRNDAGIALVQTWSSMEAFDLYRASPAFAALVETIKPAMTKPPVTTIATADTVAA
ncbi:MAG: putative quinol monooxygenase [Paracoccaceae bacterium]